MFSLYLRYIDQPSIQFSCSVIMTLCDPMDCSMPSLPVYPQLLELAQTHVHRVTHAIQRSHPLPVLLTSSCLIQSPSHVQLFVTPWTVARQVSLSFTISQSLHKFMFIESVMPSNDLILWHPLLFLPSIFPSIRGFFNESALHIWWPKYWSFSSRISLSNEYLGLTSFTIDLFGLPAVQGTQQTLLQYHSSKASILQCSAFLMVQLSCQYTNTK